MKGKWPKNLEVSTRIVGILSRSTYDSFPNAIKEIITNSYDADASRVNIEIDLANETIIIEDNGVGMSESEFEYFLTIAGQNKSQKTETQSGRLRIGKFGVGFLSVFPFFRNYFIESKKEQVGEVLFASIPCFKYFDNRQIVRVNEIEVDGGTRLPDTTEKKNFTRIKLSGFTELSTRYFFPNLEEKKPPRKSILARLSPIQQIQWHLSEDLPLEYENEKFNALTKRYSPNKPFKVFVNERPLLRKVHAKQIQEINEKYRSEKGGILGNEEIEISPRIKKIGNIEFMYFILSDKVPVEPSEGRFIKVRNLNAGVGNRTVFGMGQTLGGNRSRIFHLTGELHLISGMNDFISVARDDFNINPDYEKVKKFIRDRLTFQANRIEKEHYILEHRTSNIVKDIKVLPEKEKNFESPVEINLGEKSYNIKSIAKVEKELPDLALEKTIKFGEERFRLVSSSWPLTRTKFPAIKMEGNEIIVNKKYPLFKSRSNTDIFVKLHILLFQKFEQGIINEQQYGQFNTDLLNVYKDYLK